MPADFDIPCICAHVVTKITGRDRVDGVEVTPLSGGMPDFSRSFRLDCDTVLLSVGLIPENELSRKAGVPLCDETAGPIADADLMTAVPGIFACGNVLHVHDLVDYVVEESRRCGQAVCRWLAGSRGRQFGLAPGAHVRSVTPNYYSPQQENTLYIRSLVVKNDAVLTLRIAGNEIRRRKLPHVQPSEMIKLTLKPADFPEMEDGRENVMEAAIE